MLSACKDVTPADIKMFSEACIALVENICSLVDIATTGGYFARHS